MRQVFESAVQKNFLVLGFRFFMSEIRNGVGFWPFLLRLPGPGPNHKREVFRSSFYLKLG